MRHLDLVTCQWMSNQWLDLIRDGYTTAIVSDEGVAVMWKGFAARDHTLHVMARVFPMDTVHG